MPKIDTTLIEGYESMNAEEKLTALEAFEYDDYSSEVQRYKNAATKANGEAATWKKKHNELLSQDELAKQKNAETLEDMKNELETLRKEKTVSGYKAKYLAQGYEEALAAETAEALANGDMDKVFANHQKYIEKHDAALKTDLIKGTPKPPAGHDVTSVNYEKEISAAMQRGDMARAAALMREQQTKKGD